MTAAGCLGLLSFAEEAYVLRGSILFCMSEPQKRQASTASLGSSNALIRRIARESTAFGFIRQYEVGFNSANDEQELPACIIYAGLPKRVGK